MQKGKADFEDVGIMAGFKDLMNAPDEVEEEDERDSYEEDNRDQRIADRRPDSPEILMNHLRGDMRSLDARRDELADMVGYDIDDQCGPCVVLEMTRRDAEKIQQSLDASLAAERIDRKAFKRLSGAIGFATAAAR
jgi:hypothetical protein